MRMCQTMIEHKFYLQAGKFHYEQMKANLQNEPKFLCYLLAFLPIMRSVKGVLKEELKGNKRLLTHCNSKMRDWEKNRIMEFFRYMRNVSVHKRPPDILTCALVPLVSVMNPKMFPEKGQIISYVFSMPEGFDKNGFHEDLDVMSLCKKYLDETEKYVSEIEEIIMGERSGSEEL